MIRIYLETLTPAGYIWEQSQHLLPQKTIQFKYMGMEKVILKAIIQGQKYAYTSIYKMFLPLI